MGEVIKALASIKRTGLLIQDPKPKGKKGQKTKSTSSSSESPKVDPTLDNTPSAEATVNLAEVTC